jgi:ABC-type uncharacterized transport system permease subunit
MPSVVAGLAEPLDVESVLRRVRFVMGARQTLPPAIVAAVWTLEPATPNGLLHDVPGGLALVVRCPVLTLIGALALAATGRSTIRVCAGPIERGERFDLTALVAPLPWAEVQQAQLFKRHDSPWPPRPGYG